MKKKSQLNKWLIQYSIFLQGSILEPSAGARIKARVARRNSSYINNFYILGMSFKLYKIYKGEYIEEEPVFMKYK